MRRNGTISLNEVSFYNTNGDEISITNLVNQMINYYNMKQEVGETQITDFNEGSEIRNLLEAFAVLEYARLEEEKANTEIAFIQTSYGMWLDRIGELPFINLPRVEGEVSTGRVEFTLAVEQEADYVIPAGTIVSDSANELDFVTLADATIFTGEDSVGVRVECMDTGVDGNVPAGNIDTIKDTDIDTELVSVTNPDALVGGSDYEEDDDYRARLLGNVQADGFGTMGWYTTLCEAVSGVHDVKLVDDSTYTKRVLVNGYDKPTPDSVLLDVLAELTVSDNIVLGHSFTVDLPTYTTVDLDISIDVVTEIDEDELVNVVTTLFNGGDAVIPTSFDGLSIDGVLTREELVAAVGVFEDIVEVTSILVDDEEVESLDPGVGGVLSLGEVVFSQSVVS